VVVRLSALQHSPCGGRRSHRAVVRSAFSENGDSGYQSTSHTVMSSRSQLITRISSNVTRLERTHNKTTGRRNFYLHAGHVAPRNIAQHGQRNYGKQAYDKTYAMQCSSVWLNLGLMRAISKSPTMAKLLNMTSARSEGTVNSSQHSASDTTVNSSHDFMV